jgi:hypothetical protein
LSSLIFAADAGAGALSKTDWRLEMSKPRTLDEAVKAIANDIEAVIELAVAQTADTDEAITKTMAALAESQETLAKAEDVLLGIAAERAAASSPRVGSETFTAALKRFADAEA